MDTFLIVSISAFTSLLFNLSFHTIYNPLRKKCKSVVREPPKKNVHREPPKVFVPNVLARWPWSRQINPHYAVLEEESAAWMSNLQPWSPKAQKIIDKGKFALLACLAHPTATQECAKAACDLVNFLFVVDEYAEKSTPPEVEGLRSIILDAFQKPHTPRPKGEWIGGEMARQLWERNLLKATETSSKRFFREMDEYLKGVVQESTDRGQHHVLDIKTYIKERRHTAATMPFFVINELGFDIPDEVMSHPILEAMTLTASDMIAHFNDMLSYNVEQMRGEELHNIITCVMKEYDTDVNGAMLWVENHLHQLEDQFLAAFASLPQWDEPLNSQVKEYCNGLGQWVRGNYEWSFESERYLGSRGLEIKENKWMSLLPRKTASKEVGPVEVDGSML